MSLPHLLLGMLAEPASGYDLKRSFEGSIRYFWSAELSQIYPALKRLEGDGLLASTVEESTEGPERRVYHRTAQGRAALRDWLSDGPIVRQERLAYLFSPPSLLGTRPRAGALSGTDGTTTCGPSVNCRTTFESWWDRAAGSVRKSHLRRGRMDHPTHPAQARVLAQRRQGPTCSLYH